MRTLILLLTVTLILSNNVVAADGKTDTRSITVDARSELRVTPDEAVLDFSIRSQQKALLDAKAENDRLAVTLIRVIKKLDFDKETFRITDLEISPWYTSRPQRLMGYVVERSFQIRTADFKKIEPSITAIVTSAGDAAQIQQLKFRVKDQRKHQTEARRLAMEYAREKASHLAKLNGMKLGQPSKISEDVEYNDGSNRNFSGFGGGFSQLPPSKRDLYYVSQSNLVAQPSQRIRADGTPVPTAPLNATKEEMELLLSPGQVSLNATVSVTFDLVPEK